MRLGSKDKSILESAYRITENISNSGLSIYDKIEIGDPDLWIPSKELEFLLNEKLRGLDLNSLPLRTRSKVVKSRICEVLGYPVPSSFTKTKPRFPGQNFDTYTQKSNNLQIWNEEISASRRYVLIRVSPENIISKIKVVTGDMLSSLDKTGTLTQKYQARLIVGDKNMELVSPKDTNNLTSLVSENYTFSSKTSPTDYPSAESLLSIETIFHKLKPIVGQSFRDLGSDQERNRGAELHRLVCEHLGYSNYKDDGRFPDVKHQLLEVKLQTSPTIDLGLFRPDSQDILDIPKINGRQIRHCDVRYVLFYAEIINDTVKITHFFLTNGEDFFSRFPQFQGKVLNSKLQIPLPKDFFD
ncbi:restriction endonuclease [Aneurinibacillus thermoaerophilus]|uniref:restriction endonuclease n=1 Tax=Aneurinibacillus thermoaerophilus TaxID=143495 RepID=UPI002E1EDF28|nr:restriction endonuclease [Aneurinibacillus thermoaerophilus]MED0764082.1 restriction endonuclease [Aneurinibacillus thermoaerophilus]